MAELGIGYCFYNFSNSTVTWNLYGVKTGILSELLNIISLKFERMKKLMTGKTAAIILIISLFFLMIFHLLVAIGILPNDIVWGGTLESDSVRTYEMVSFIITGVLLFFTFVKAGYIKNPFLQKLANIIIWIMVVFFGFMVLGNLVSKTMTEKLIFIPLSIILFVTSLRLAIERNKA
jgi:hypothetical protein